MKGVPLTCPRCRLPDLLDAGRTADGLACSSCGAAYPLVDGIPVMVPSAADPHKRHQADYTDHDVDEQWETSRPHGAPAFYGWLLEEKFRRSVAALPDLAPGTTVLTVCGGSGLDAEFLARRGARVVSTDISLEAARRTRERARRFGVDIEPVVADAERLPFPDRSFDVVYVHDGLHHLEDPLVGLAEMTRVSARAVSVNEPARAAVTAVAVRLGLAMEREEAGNRVARVTLDEISEALRRAGFLTVEASRFAMYYRHAPGPAAGLLSRRWTFPLAKAAVLSLNRAIGPIGNKLTIQARRVDATAPEPLS